MVEHTDEHTDEHAGPSGLWVPLVTPFADDGAVDTDGLAALAARVLDDGADGLVALGTTGEPSALDPAERDTAVAVCAEVAADRGAGLIVGAGTNDTRTTVARHEALADVPGVTASLAVVPYHVRPSEAAVVAHLRYVAERSPVPVVAYNVPRRTGRGLGAAALIELAGTPNVVGVKQAVASVDADTVELLAAGPAGFAVLPGDDPFLLPVVLLGGHGGVTASAHVATGVFAALVADARAGRVADARRHGATLLPLVTALFAEPNPAVIKAVLHAQGRIATPEVRMPLQPAGNRASGGRWTSWRHCRAGDPQNDEGTTTAVVAVPVRWVGEGGVEPPHPSGYTDLNRARLPFRHSPGSERRDRNTGLGGHPEGGRHHADADRYHQDDPPWCHDTPAGRRGSVRRRRRDHGWGARSASSASSRAWWVTPSHVSSAARSSHRRSHRACAGRRRTACESWQVGAGWRPIITRWCSVPRTTNGWPATRRPSPTP